MERPAPVSSLDPAGFIACHPGVRRSEILRRPVGDLDVEANRATVIERKKSRGKRTARGALRDHSLVVRIATVPRHWYDRGEPTAVLP